VRPFPECTWGAQFYENVHGPVRSRTLVLWMLSLPPEVNPMKWKWLGTIAMATVVAGLLINLKDIARYVKISTM